MERLTLRMSVIQTFIAVISFVVAIFALYAALNESDAVRKQQQASVWPSLEFEVSFRTVPGSEQLDIHLQNSGIGPAKIESIELFLDETRLENWAQLIATFTSIEAPLFSYNSVSRRVLRPDDQYSLLSVTAEELGSETVIALQQAAKDDRIAGEICYCSVFKDCWVLEAGSRDPSEIAQCPQSQAKSAF